MIFSTSELTPFQCISTSLRNRDTVTKRFWINLIRSRSSNKTAHFVAKGSWTTVLDETSSNVFTSFSITYNTDESKSTSEPGNHLVTRHYIPARLTSVDHAAIDNFSGADWKTIKIHKGITLQALRVWTENPVRNLVLPTASLYAKRVYRDLDSASSDPPSNKRTHMTPAQSFDVERASNSNNPAGSVVEEEVPAVVNLHDSEATNTLPTLKSILPPPRSITEQVRNTINPEHMRKQRDFPTPQLLSNPSFSHITQQMNNNNSIAFPNIYLRLTIVTNHVYHVFTKNLNHLKDHSCITLVDGERLLHFVPIKAPSERHRQLYKNFSKANVEMAGFGSWIPLPNLPDLAPLSKTVPMREHFSLMTYIEQKY